MTVTLRPFQAELKREIYARWQRGVRNVLAVSPTGSGKTVLFSDILHSAPGASVAIAHRQELVSQISLALARNGVRHRIIGPKAVARACSAIHVGELRRTYVDPTARCAVAGVDTLIRMDGKDPWFAQVGLWVSDESHHLLTDNKWGQATRMFPNAYGLGVTATPCRADGRGLGRHADGLMDEMIVGPSMRDLINDGFLTEYRIFAPPSDIDMSQVTISAGGDYSPPKLASAVHGSHIVGDVVAHYLRIAPGKLGVTFAVDVAAAAEQAAAFRQAGVPSEVVSAKTPDALRVNILRRFAAGEIKQLCNCDLFGEGFDLPAIEVVSMARPTASFSLYAQQFGRSMRIMEGKTHAIVIDHVGNVHRHGLPDAPRVWTLDRRERRSRGTPDDVVKVRTCPECTGTYERVLGLTCPFCNHTIEPVGRSGPDMVDGDLSEMTPEALARLRGEIDRDPMFPYGAAPEVIGAIKKRHREKAEAQTALREAMARWGGIRTAAGDDIATAQRRFYITYGIDVATAQTLNRAEADELRGRIGL